MIELPHVAARPGWTCQSCGQDWPCAPVRKEMVEEFTVDGTTRTNLMTFLAYQMALASDDLPVGAAGNIYDRFLGWAAGSFSRTTAGQQRPQLVASLVWRT